ncbi:RING finger protein 151 [Amia ocellicauda]|uniref:RING finger protein 151 n=1 Tax=Amia ocellicauda TaxID=2972642 RepID=UPI0034638E0A
MSGGYDVELFAEAPDYDLICTICRGVLRCPVRVACNHVFCKRCILQWLKRQETCPCCRKPVNQSLMFVMYKLSKAISRLQIKCKNEIHGCTATFPLSEQYCHSTGCLFERTACPHEGCSAIVLRRELEGHMGRCEHWRQPCQMGCGTVLSHQTQAQHNCYRQLRREYEAQQQTHRAIATTLQKKMKKMQSTMVQMKRQLGLICESLEVMDNQEEGEGEDAGEGNSSSSSSS